MLESVFWRQRPQRDLRAILPIGGQSTPPWRRRRAAGGALELPGRPHRGQKRAREPYVDVLEASGRATRACNLRGIARASHFRGTCWREVCRGRSDDDFGGPRRLPHAICEGLWPSPNPPWSLRGIHTGVRSAPVSLVSTSHRPRGGPREHVIYEGSRAHPIFAALAGVKCV